MKRFDSRKVSMNANCNRNGPLYHIQNLEYLNFLFLFIFVIILSWKFLNFFIFL